MNSGGFWGCIVFEMGVRFKIGFGGLYFSLCVSQQTCHVLLDFDLYVLLKY